MEHMVNSKFIKELRNKRSWSQDHLASVSGLSLRTIQRIEKEGNCSLESKKALAAVFEVKTTDFDLVVNSIQKPNIIKGRRYGYLGAAAGIFCSYFAITYSLVNENITWGDAGVFYGVVGALTGISCGLIGHFSGQFSVTSV
jgi:DNA-binding XRE family transcriptional regulator